MKNLKNFETQDIIAVANSKGGVGKTTATLNLGAVLTELGYEVLVVDLDPKASLTVSFGLEPSGKYFTMYDVLVDRKPISHAIARIDSLDVSLSAPELQRAEIELSSQIDGVLRLRKALSRGLPMYDCMIIDCPPSLGQLTANALIAADYVLVPTLSHPLDTHSLKQLLETVHTVRDDFNPGLEILGIFDSMYEPGKNNEPLPRLSDPLKEYMLTAKVRTCDKIPGSQAKGKPVIRDSPQSEGAIDFRALTNEILKRISGKGV